VAVEAGWLWFWHLKPRKKSDPEALSEQLADGKVPAELQELPVDEILAALQEQYPSLLLDRDARAGEVDMPEEQTAIEPCWSSKHFVFTFYGDAWKQMDRVVELMTRFGLACYDSGERKMYTVQKPPRFTGTPDQEAIQAEWEKVMREESAKIEAAAPNRLEAVKLKQAWVESGGIKRAREDAIRRVQSRKGG
jgi:hypothetical protein